MDVPAMSATVIVSRVIDAPASDLYQTFIDPVQHVAWGPTRFRNDPVPGGTFRQETDMNDSTYIIDGDYRELVPDRLIAMNWGFHEQGVDQVDRFEVTIAFEPGVDGGTRVTATETGPSITQTAPGDGYHEAWEQVFTALEQYLADRARPNATGTRES
jgi:uncharacterized protein YndB with AHSA1/START domain